MNLAELASQNGLHRVGARPGLWQYLHETWSRRDFVFTMASYRMRANLETNRLGVFWLILRPVLDALIYGTIFGLLQVGNRPPDYAVYVVIGVFLFQFFTKSLTNGSKSITKHRALVQSLSFPRMTLPLAEVAEQFLSLLPSMAFLLVILPFMGHLPSLQWLYLIPLLALYTLFNTGIALFAARLTVHIRDLTQLLPFISRILFYSSGVLFDINRIFDSWPWLVSVFDWYPIYQVLQLARCFLRDEPMNPMYWVSLAVWAVVVFIGGVLFFWVAEERYGRD